MGSGVTVLTELALPSGVETERVRLAVLADLRSGKQRSVVVDSPPGAGNSTLVVRAAVELAAYGGSLVIFAQADEQVHDQKAPQLRIGQFSAADYKSYDWVKARKRSRLVPRSPAWARRWSSVPHQDGPWDETQRPPLRVGEALRADVRAPTACIADLGGNRRAAQSRFVDSAGAPRRSGKDP